MKTKLTRNLTGDLTRIMLQTATLLKKRLQHMFYYKFCEIIWNNFFVEHLRTTACGLTLFFNLLSSESCFSCSGSNMYGCIPYFIDILMSKLSPPPSFLRFLPNAKNCHMRKYSSFFIIH